MTFFCLIVLIVISRPIVIAPSLVIFVIFYYLKRVFISSSRDLLFIVYKFHFRFNISKFKPTGPRISNYLTNFTTK